MNKKVKKFMVEIGFENLINHIEHELEEDELQISINEMLTEHTDADRFAGWLESDYEEYCDDNDIECDSHFEALETFYNDNTKYITNQISELA